MYRLFVFLVLSVFLFFGTDSLRAQQTDEQIASYYYQNKEYDKAAELYEGLYNKAQNKFYYQMLYSSYLELERYRDAVHLVEKRLKKYPKDLYLMVDLGEVYLKEGERKKATKAFDRALEQVGRDSKQIGDLVMAFENAGHHDYAIQAYLAARKVNNNPLAYVTELATLYEKAGQYELMMDEYFGLLDQSPGMMPSVQIALQRALNETSNPQLAEGLRRTLVSRIRQNPNDKTPIYKAEEYGDTPIYLDDISTLDLVTLFAPDVYARQQLSRNDNMTNNADTSPRQIRTTPDPKAKDASNYYYDRTKWYNRTFGTDMWNAPVLMFRHTMVYDRGDNDYSITTTDGHTLHLYKDRSWASPGMPDGDLEDEEANLNSYRLNVLTIQMINWQYNQVTLDGKVIPYPSWRTLIQN